MRLALYLAFKRLFDVVLSFIAVVVLSPLLVVVALLIKFQSPGPVIHKRKCVKKDGYYYMYKFRSMVYDAENLDKYLTRAQQEEYHRNIKVIHDPRVTKLGRILRKTSIDELPQLFNVLKGDMSLVGVRPLAEEEIYLYGDSLDEMLSVKPGITGYWQTHGRSNATYDSGKRQEYELYYVRNRSFLMDIKILFRTAVILMRDGEGAI